MKLRILHGGSFVRGVWCIEVDREGGGEEVVVDVDVPVDVVVRNDVDGF